MDYFERLKPILEYEGKLVMGLREQGLQVERKPDGSVVTNADKAGNDFLVAALMAAFPGDAIISEEGGGAMGADRTWLVDPIDNTKPFINGEQYFNVIIALLESATPVFGVMYFPALNEWYWAEKGKGAFAERNGRTERLRLPAPHQPLHVLHNNRSRHKLGQERQFKPEYKQMLRVALGELDAMDVGDTYFWDLAAPQLILAEAGGVTVRADGSPIRYESPEFLEPDVLCGHPMVVEKLLAQVRSKK